MKRTRCLYQKFRDVFQYPDKDTTHFYPGHMSRGMTQMQQRLKNVDCVIEVHDARIPFTGRNPRFEETITLRPHLLVLNKMDLAPPKYFQRVDTKLREEYDVKHLLYTNCKEDHHVTVKKRLMPAILEIVTGNDRYHRDGREDYNLMIIGVPNVGKSSLINAMRRMYVKKGKATAVGPHAGVTKSVLEKIRVSDSPLVYVYDSPGIMMPNINHMQVAMKLALCAALKDSIVGEELIADYMLFWLNKHQHFRYVDYFDMPGPTDNILEFLAFVAKQLDVMVKQRSMTGGYVYLPNYSHAAKCVIRAFREGQLGRYNLDQDVFMKSEDIT